MQSQRRWIAVAAITAASAVAAPAHAQPEARFSGYTNGCFGVGCSPAITNAFQTVQTGGGVLTYANASFDATTANLFLALGGDPQKTTRNFNNLGSFFVDAGVAPAPPGGRSLNGEVFNLAITFTRPSSVAGGQQVDYTAVLQGRVSADASGGYFINFADNNVRTFGVGDNPADNFFTLEIADRSVNAAGSPVDVTARINAVGDLTGQSVVPEPATIALFGAGLLGLAGVARARRRA